MSRRRILIPVAIGMTLWLSAFGAAGARPGLTSVAPYAQAYEQHHCSAEGTGSCFSDATADRQLGELWGVSRSFVSETSTESGRAFAFSRGGRETSFLLPRSGASSVTFTVDSLIESATASRSNPSLASSGEVYFFAYAWTSGGGRCVSCTVAYNHLLVDTDTNTEQPGSRTNENETFTFELKSRNGDHLKGRINLLLWLTQRTWAGPTGSPTLGLIPVEGWTVAEGKAVVNSISVTLVP